MITSADQTIVFLTIIKVVANQLALTFLNILFMDSNINFRKVKLKESLKNQRKLRYDSIVKLVANLKN